MTKRRIALFFIFLTAFSNFVVSQQKLPSKITSVVVYADRAMVTRSAVVDVKGGQQMVSFGPLTASLIGDSIRVGGKGTASARILGTELKTNFLETASEENVRDLEAEIQTLQDDVSALDSQLGVLNTQMQFLDSIKVAYAERISKELSGQGPKTADINEMLQFLRQTLTNIAAEIRKVQTKKRDTSSRLDAVKRNLGQIRGQSKKESLAVEVSLDVAKAGNLELELSYVVYGASWAPLYDIRLAEDGTKVELTYRGTVSQRTGEDWDNVDLSLSTARPSVSAQAPELSPWYFQLYRYPKGRVGAIQPAETAAPPPPVIVTGEAPLADTKKTSTISSQTASMEEQRTSVFFHIPRKENIPSDGDPHTTTIMVESLEAKTEYLCVPKLSPSVYLKSELANTTNFPFLPGRVNLFLATSFTGNATLMNVAPTEQFDLSFGADDSIKVKRDEASVHKEAGILGKNQTSYKYTIDVQNFKKDAQVITILDQIPVSRDQDAKVKLTKAAPEPTEKSEEGMLKWLLSLQPQEKKQISLEFQVEYPKDAMISGL